MRSGRAKKLLLSLLVVGLAAVGAPSPLLAGDPPALARCVLKLDPEIDCPSCEDGIKHALATAHGVRSVEIDVLNNRTTVCYNPANIEVKALVGRIRVFGYTATETK